MEEALDCQGLLLPGGGDIDPARYSQPSAGSEAPDLQRDATELELVSRFLAWGRPILGICRGIQLLNVALGGDLIQDIPTAADHKHDAVRGDRVHGVEAAPGSFLEGLYGSAFSVNSAHHQALGQVAPGLRVAAAPRRTGSSRRWSGRKNGFTAYSGTQSACPLPCAGRTRWTAGLSSISFWGCAGKNFPGNEFPS